MTTLFLDIGNTRIKWRYSNPALAEHSGNSAHLGDPSAAFYSLEWIPASRVFIASVFNTTENEKLAENIRARFGRAPVFAKTAEEFRGLRNGYDEPQRLGVDRWLALIALWSAQHSAFCVASAGTALTLDFVDDDGMHLGGYIAPGLDAMRSAVLSKTRFTHHAKDQNYALSPGKNTEDCVSEAALAACLGMLQFATKEFTGPKFLCGGNAELLKQHLDSSWTVCHDLVMDGLALAGA